MKTSSSLAAARPRLSFPFSASCALAVLAAAALASGLEAQSPAAAAAGSDVVTLEAVSVTGSNIQRLDIEKVLPVTRVSAEQIEARDAPTSVDLVVAIPQVTNIPATEATTGSQGARGDNANVSLRGIPASNTLILLNGRRLAPHGLTGNVVNINQLPTAGLDRIEVLRDGASSIYGSDAVAGVINYVSKPDFAGTELRVRYGYPEHGGGMDVGATLSHGQPFADGRGRWLSTLNTYYRDSIFLRERAFSADADKSALAPPPWNVNTSAFNGRSATTRFPSFRVGNAAATTYFRPIDGTPGFTTAAPARSDYDNVNRFTAAIPQTARINWYNAVEYELNDSITAFAEISLYGAESKMARTPVIYNAPGSDLYIVLAEDNPYNPYGSRFYHPAGTPNADGTARLTGTPQTVTLLAQSLEEGGPEKILVDSSTYRVLAGLKGKIGASSWTWESAALFSESRTKDSLINGIRESLIIEAARRTGASAYNPFGYTFRVQNGAVVADQPYVNPPAVQAGYTDEMIQEGHSFLRSLDFRTSGNVFTLPGGAVALAVGGEYREETYAFAMPDYAGLNPPESGLDPESNDFFGRAPKASYKADREIYSGYAEALLPLASPENRLPLLHSLELSAAIRFENYSDFGDTHNPKFGLNWKPAPWLMVRASTGRGFTAPDLSTLYAPASFTTASPPGVIDPVRNPVINDARVLVRTISTGNQDLQPEKSEGRTIGVAFDVPGVRGLSLTADYWELDRKGVITSVGGGDIYASDNALLRAFTQQQLAAGVPIDQIDAGSGTDAYKGDPRVVRLPLTPNDRAAFAAANAALPSNQQLAAIGVLRSITTFSTNSRGKNFYSGLDFGLNYFLPELPVGRFSLSADWAYFLDYYTQATPGAAKSFSIGEEGTPRNKGSVVLGWRKGGWSASVSGYYSSSVTGSATTTEGIYESLGRPDYIKKAFDNGIWVYRYVAGDSLTFNASLGYRFGGDTGAWFRHTSIRLGVNNLTDEEPPLSSAAAGYSSSSSQHLVAGRTWTLQLTRQF